MFEYVVRKGGLKESEARWFFQQLIIGVDYLHRMVQCWQSTCCTIRDPCEEPRKVLLGRTGMYCITVCQAVQHLSEVVTSEQTICMQGVASRDIKLENTLLDGSPRPLLKICDFGYSKVGRLPALMILPDKLLQLSAFLSFCWISLGC